jgi:poly-gamma-glutamate capsule biosynthesis protein CapA/YwtB (metallophosphatase superfamily)
VSAVTLFLGGDLMTGRGVDQIFARSCAPRLYEPFVTSALDYVELAERAHGPIPKPVDDAYVWGDALDVLARVQPDVRIVNLETSVTTSDAAESKGINYRMHPANVPVLSAARIDCVVLANNHVLDWGESGLLDTLDVVKAAGVAVAGAGRDLDEARAPAVIALKNGCRVLVFALGARDSGIPEWWGAEASRAGLQVLADFSDASADEVGRFIAHEKRAGDIAVASIHWGSNWGYEIPDAHRRFAHRLIDGGSVDVVYGHSSHHPKAIEVHQGRLILYGCGDLLDDYEGISGQDEYRDDLVLMYFPTIDATTGRLTQLAMTPMQIHRMRLRHTSLEDREWLRRVLDRECRAFGHRVVERDDGLQLEWT